MRKNALHKSTYLIITAAHVLHGLAIRNFFGVRSGICAFVLFLLVLATTLASFFICSVARFCFGLQVFSHRLMLG